MTVDAKKQVEQASPNLATRGFTIHRNVAKKAEMEHGGVHDAHAHKEKKRHGHGGSDNGGFDEEFPPSFEEMGGLEQERGEEGGKEGVFLPAGVPSKKKERAVVVVGDGNLKGAFIGEIIDR